MAEYTLWVPGPVPVSLQAASWSVWVRGLQMCHQNPKAADSPIQLKGINYRFAAQPSSRIGNPAADMRNGGGAAKQTPGLKDTLSALQSVLQAGDVGPGPGGGGKLSPLWDSRLAEGTADPQFAPSKAG